ncbi:hypothetical protein [Oceanobacillus sp. FSL H7-0719]|uniref:hypothetical protein n=1 Tax=Oceanobacillus sp. FSL H7-0719 TaxID=2954507 RepID=UPI00324FAB31
MDYTISINGFHGTSKNAASNILKGKKYTYNEREDHWLGQGIYFFKDDPDQAMSWGLTQVDNGERAAVLQTVINVQSSSSLDLNTRSGIHKFKELQKIILKEAKEKGIEVNTQKDETDHNFEKKFRCFILDLLPPHIKVIQNYFKLDKQPGFVLKSEIMERLNIEMYSVQICVRDPRVIDEDTIEVYKEKRKQIHKNLKFKKPTKRKRNIIVK